MTDQVTGPQRYVLILHKNQSNNIFPIVPELSPFEYTHAAAWLFVQDSCVSSSIPLSVDRRAFRDMWDINRSSVVSSIIQVPRCKDFELRSFTPLMFIMVLGSTSYFVHDSAVALMFGTFHM